jgi:probable rRNA maturation factor
MTRCRGAIVENRNKSYTIRASFIKKVIGMVLSRLKKTEDLEIEVIFVDDPAIKKLNKIYKKSDRTTDVLSFGLDARVFGIKKLIGSVFISLDTARANAERFRTSFEEEIVLYVIHGILHLAGYDDGTNAEIRRMRAEEKRILERICKTGNLSKVLTRR